MKAEGYETEMRIKLHKLIVALLSMYIPLTAENKNESVNKNTLLITGSISKINLIYSKYMPYLEPSFRNGFSAGLRWEHCFSRHFSIKVGLEYTTAGDNQKYDIVQRIVIEDSNGNPVETGEAIRIFGNRKRTLTYVALPIHLCYKLSSIQSGLFLGGSSGYTLTAHQNLTEYSGEYKNKESMSILKEINRNNILLHGGYYYEPPELNRNVIIGVMYSEGLTPIGTKEHWTSEFRCREIRLFIDVKIVT